MLKLAFLVFSCVVVCNATVPVQIVCAYLPTKVYNCLATSKILNKELSKPCNDGDMSLCERLTCVFNNAGWFSEGKLDKQNLTKYMDGFSKDHPALQHTVELVKTKCVTADLSPQGPYPNCPAYDVTDCVFNNFITNAEASQWTSSPYCNEARMFAGACPMCLVDCLRLEDHPASCETCLSQQHFPEI